MPVNLPRDGAPPGTGSLAETRPSAFISVHTSEGMGRVVHRYNIATVETRAAQALFDRPEDTVTRVVKLFDRRR